MTRQSLSEEAFEDETQSLKEVKNKPEMGEEDTRDDEMQHQRP